MPSKLNIVAGMYARDMEKRKAAGEDPNAEPNNSDKVKYEAFDPDYDEQSPKKKVVKPVDISKSIKKFQDE